MGQKGNLNFDPGYDDFQIGNGKARQISGCFGFMLGFRPCPAMLVSEPVF